MPTASASVNFKLDFFATPDALRQIEKLTFDYLAKDMRRVIVPMMRQVTPDRSGRLRKSIKIRRTRTGIRILADFYWTFQQGLNAKYFAIYQEQLSTLLQRSFNRAVAEVLPPFTPGR